MSLWLVLLDEEWDHQVEELRKQLWKAGVKSAVPKTTTMHGVKSNQPNSASINFRHAVHTEVETEGCRVKAVIDTGSVATVVSLGRMIPSWKKFDSFSKMGLKILW